MESSGTIKQLWLCESQSTIANEFELPFRDRCHVDVCNSRINDIFDLYTSFIRIIAIEVVSKNVVVDRFVGVKKTLFNPDLVDNPAPDGIMKGYMG